MDVRAFVGLGSNLGDREARLAFGAAELRATAGVEVLAASRLYETAPVGPPGQGPYLNAALALRVELTARALLARLLAIERATGRVRGERWGPRPLDLDLLLYGDRVIREAALEVPHPRLVERPFVLEPLAEIASDVRHPVTGATIGSLARSVRDPDAVRPYAGSEWARASAGQGTAAGEEEGKRDG